MITQELLYQLFVELIKLFVPGILGGIVGSVVSFWLFKAQRKFDTKRDDQIKKQEALRDIDLTTHWIRRDISVNWESSPNEKLTPGEYMFELVNKIHYWETLFLDDPEISKTLSQFYSLVGVGKDSFYGKDKDNQKMPGEIINEIRTSVRKKILEIDISLKR